MHRVSGCDNLVANRARPPWVRAGLNSNNKGLYAETKDILHQQRQRVECHSYKPRVPGAPRIRER